MTLKLLWVGDSPTLFTGFGRVGKEILTRLHRTGDYDIACLGWYYDGRPYDTTELPFEIYRTGNTEYGQDVLGKIVEHRQIDAVVSLGDVWMIQWIAHLPERAKVRWLGYFPLDGGPLPTAWIPVLRNMDEAVCYSKFSQDVIADADPTMRTHLIYHGVNTNVFRPLPDKAALKREEGIGNRFVVGCVARNQNRKQIPILIKAFAKFAAGKEDVFLYLHMAPRDAGWDVPELLKRHRLQYKSYVSGVTPTVALPTMGEGFGLPIVEAMSVGIPVVVTNYSACVELVEGRGELIAVKDFLTMGINNIDQAIADTDDLAAKLEKPDADAVRVQPPAHLTEGERKMTAKIVCRMTLGLLTFLFGCGVPFLSGEKGEKPMSEEIARKMDKSVTEYFAEHPDGIGIFWVSFYIGQDLKGFQGVPKDDPAYLELHALEDEFFRKELDAFTRGERLDPAIVREFNEKKAAPFKRFIERRAFYSKKWAEEQSALLKPIRDRLVSRVRKIEGVVQLQPTEEPDVAPWITIRARAIAIRKIAEIPEVVGISYVGRKGQAAIKWSREVIHAKQVNDSNPPNVGQFAKVAVLDTGIGIGGIG